MFFCASRRLERPVQPQRGGSSARESVCVFRGLLQTEVPGAARQVRRRVEPCTSPDSGVQRELSNTHTHLERQSEAGVWGGWGVQCVFTFKIQSTKAKPVDKQSLPPATDLTTLLRFSCIVSVQFCFGFFTPPHCLYRFHSILMREAGEVEMGGALGTKG